MLNNEEQYTQELGQLHSNIIVNNCVVYSASASYLFEVCFSNFGDFQNREKWVRKTSHCLLNWFSVIIPFIEVTCLHIDDGGSVWGQGRGWGQENNNQQKLLKGSENNILQLVKRVFLAIWNDMGYKANRGTQQVHMILIFPHILPTTHSIKPVVGFVRRKAAERASQGEEQWISPFMLNEANKHLKGYRLV